MSYEDTNDPGVWATVQDTAKLVFADEPITGRALAGAAATDITRTGLTVAAKVAGAEVGRRAATHLARQQASVTIPAVQALLAGTASTETAVRLAEALGKQGARSSLVSRVVGKGLGAFVAPLVAAVKLAVDDEEHDLDEYVRVIGVKAAGSVVTLACSAAGPLGTVAGIGASIWVENQLEEYLDGQS